MPPGDSGTGLHGRTTNPESQERTIKADGSAVPAGDLGVEWANVSSLGEHSGGTGPSGLSKGGALAMCVCDQTLRERGAECSSRTSYVGNPLKTEPGHTVNKWG